MSIGSGIQSIGQGFADFSAASGEREAAKGDRLAAVAYGKASSIAEDNALLTRRSGQIEAEQEQRTITQAIGAENADVAAAGFEQSGSAFYLLKSSLQQGALSKQLLANQTEITAQGYEQQSTAYAGQQQASLAEASAHEAASVGDQAKGTSNIIGGILGFFGL